MNHGQIVESGIAKAVFSNPQHPYTQALLAAVPDIAEAEQRAQQAE
jgi:peptide/nickel transport system ATP-binding protein